MRVFAIEKLAERVDFLTPSVSALLKQVWMDGDWFTLNETVVRHYAHKAAVASIVCEDFWRLNPAAPIRFLEIGTRCGYSAAVFFHAVPACMIQCLDGGVDEDSGKCLEWARRMFSRMDMKATLVEVDTRSVKSVSRSWFAHIDADHSHLGCLRDLRLASLSKVILADDYDNPAVAEAVKQFCRETGRRAEVYDDGLRKGAVIE